MEESALAYGEGQCTDSCYARCFCDIDVGGAASIAQHVRPVSVKILGTLFNFI